MLRIGNGPVAEAVLTFVNDWPDEGAAMARRTRLAATGIALSALTVGASMLAGAGAAQAQSAFFDNILYDGFYFGGQVGGISGHGSVEYYGSELGSWPNAGASAGVFGGFNFLHGDILFGIEGDLNVGRIVGEGVGGGGSPSYEYGSTVDFYGSIRKRLGLVFGPWTIFGTAGLAFAHSMFWGEACYPTCYDYYDQSLMHVGATGGVGAEYQLTENISARGDVRLYSFRPVDVQLGVSSDYPHSLSFVVASVGVVVHFD
jgi:outer membrane immunogenic protein